jgi:hypothetical protein
LVQTAKNLVSLHTLGSEVACSTITKDMMGVSATSPP